MTNWKLPAVESHARTEGYNQSLKSLYDTLTIEWDNANEVFMLFRENDSSYSDPRTDYTLGRRDAIENLMSLLREEIRKTR